MRIVSLEPFITDTLKSLGVTESIVGVSAQCDPLQEGMSVPILTGMQESSRPEYAALSNVLSRLSSRHILVAALVAARPTHVFLSPEPPQGMQPDYLESTALRALVHEAAKLLSEHVGAQVEVHLAGPCTLAQVFEGMILVGKAVGQKQKGQEMAQRVKAQLMDWGDNFYDRMKNKRVTFLSSVEPLRLGGRWIPDLISLASCSSEEPVAGGADRDVTWPEILSFRPDVIVVAPRGLGYKECLSTFKVLEKLPGWEDAPAVKRGEVHFCEGERLFYRPGPALLDGMGVLVSAIAGIDSGYITKRDSFVRLRYLEMQRHKY